MKHLFYLLLFICLVPSVYSQRRMENLDRGLVAAKVTNGVYINWRIPAQEWRNVNYNLYRDQVKLNTAPITGASNYVDVSGTLTSKYKVTAIIDGVEQPACPEVAVQPNPYFEITLKPIPKIDGVPETYYNDYRTNDITTADLDGDGAYDFIVKRMNEGYDSANPFENKYYTLFDAYKSDGTFMWRIDVGPNLFHNVEITVIAYDFDGDGKAEIVMRTSEGTVDGLGNTIPDLGNAQGANTPDGKTNYRDRLQNNGQWFEYEGPEYLSLFDGETGEMLDRIDHIARQPVSQWGTSGTQAGGLAHRSTKFFYGAPYLDGLHPSLLITRGIYYRTKMVTYDIVDRKFVKRWDFDSGTGAYCGQGNHNYSIADVDNDGCDEIVYGSMTVDDDGLGLYSTGLGHGDAIHVGDFDPYRKGLEVFACLEESPYYGTTLRAAEDGKILLQYIAGKDCGRCIAANWSNAYAGAELAPAGASGGVCSASTRSTIPVGGGSQNFRIFWDGDLLEELVDHNNFSTTTGKGVGKVQKYNGASWSDILVTTGYYSCNHTKGTPCLQADLFGDWREELIYKSDDESKIRIYFTTIPTEYRIYTLMHDLQYRQAIAWQMCGYNQPPHVSYFLGELEGITVPPPPVIANDKLVYAGNNNWKKNGQTVSYANGQDLLYDVSGHGATVTLTGSPSPKSLTVNSPQNYVFDASAANLNGEMTLVKQGSGTVTFNGTHAYTGVTELWDGLTVFDGQLSQSSVWLNRFAELSVKGTLGKNLTLEYGATVYPGGKETASTLSVGGDLTLKEGAVAAWDLDNNAAQCDKLNLIGKLQITGKAIFRITKTGDLTPGNYILIQAGDVEGALSGIIIEGLDTQITSLSFTGGNVVLSVANMRAAAAVVWKGDKAGAVWNLADEKNWTLNGSEAYFAVDDNVTFDDSGVSKIVNKTGNLQAGNIVIDAASDYVIQGEGKISGAGSLSKSGAGKLTLKGINEYTGATIIEGGTLAVETMPNLDQPGAVGYPSSDPNLFILNDATFTTTGSTVTSARALKTGDKGATINANVKIDWDEVISGKKLIKTGAYELALFRNNASLDTLIIRQGSVSLKTEEANAMAAKTVVLESGTLHTLDGSGSYSTSSWNIAVPQSKSGTINLDSRCNYTGKLTGTGTLTIMSPFVRSDLSGNWSEFTGVINATSDSDGGDLRFNNNYGLANAELNVTGQLNVYNNTGNAFTIGALSGSANAKLTGNHLWTIGARNTPSTFAGTITAGSLTKTGTAYLKLSNVNTYTGTTTINGGRLIVTVSGGSGTGSGNVVVNNTGSIAGTGIIGGNVSVAAGGLVEPGDESVSSWSGRLGTLTLEKNLTLNGSLKMGVRNAAGYLSDKLIVKGNVALNGSLQVEIVNGAAAFPLGVELSLLDITGTVAGAFTSLDLPPTDAGTIWDTSELLTTGKIKVIVQTGINTPWADYTITVYPNPAKEYITVDVPFTEQWQIEILDLSGKPVLSKPSPVAGEKIDISALPQGFYLVKIRSKEGLKVLRLIKE